VTMRGRASFDARSVMKRGTGVQKDEVPSIDNVYGRQITHQISVDNLSILNQYTVHGVSKNVVSNSLQ